jgi:hypothetical protein
MFREISKPAEVLCDENELSQHDRAIQKLVHELQLPPDEVERCYIMAIVDILKKDPTAGDLLPILGSRCVKERFQHK